MPGIFSKANRPKRPGSYTNFIASQQATVQPSTGSVVCIPLVHDWGPYKVTQRVNSYAQFQQIYGTNLTAGAQAVQQCFRGEDAFGRGGAGAVLVYRFGGSSAAKATKTIQNTTPATALTLTAKYEGTKGNSLTVTSQDYAANAAYNELIIYDGTTEVERYQYLDTDIADLANQINASSSWVTANANITGVALNTSVTASPFTGGDNGTSIVAGDFTNALAAVEVERFGVFAFYDLDGATYGGGATPTTILASLKAWATTSSGVAGLNQKGKRFTVVVGGGSAESVSTANTRSGTLNDENFVNLGYGTYKDSGITGSPTLNTSQLAPRIAGVIACRGEAQSITFARLGGLSIVTGPTEANILSGFDNGTLMLSRDSNSVAPVRIEKALTTYTTKTDTTRPYTVYRNIKFVRTMQGLEMDLTEWAEGPDGPVGSSAPINEKSRSAVLSQLASLLGQRQDAKVIQPGFTVLVDQNPPPSDDDEFIGVAYTLKFTRTAEQVFNSIVVG